MSRRNGADQKLSTFRITFTTGADAYGIVPLDPHPDVARIAYRFCKHTGDREVYDVRLSAEGFVECDCKGFQSVRKPCIHIRMLVRARMLPAEVLQPQGRAKAEVEGQPASRATCYRSLGDMLRSPPWPGAEDEPCDHTAPASGEEEEHP